MKPRNVIIDCDTGIDDALALLLALRSPQFNVLGITCVTGNVGINKVVRNTCVVVEHSGKLVPCHELVREAADIARSLGRPIATVQQARQMMGMEV